MESRYGTTFLQSNPFYYKNRLFTLVIFPTFLLQAFRIKLDEKRKMFDHLTAEEQAQFKESIRLFRHPKFSQAGLFYDTMVNEKPILEKLASWD